MARQRLAGADLAQAGPHRPPAVLAEALDPARRGRHGEGGARVGEVAVLLGGDVDVDEVARPDRAIAGNAVRDLLVDADAGRAGKAVDHLGRGARARILHDTPPDAVELEGRHAGLDGTSHRLERVGDDAPDHFEGREVVLARHRHVRSSRAKISAPRCPETGDKTRAFSAARVSTPARAL